MPRAGYRAIAIPLDELATMREALLLSPEASPLDTIRELWKAFNRLRKEAHKAEGQLGQQEPGAFARESAPFVPQVPHDPEALQQQLDLEAARLEKSRIELDILREKSKLKAQESYLEEKKRKTAYWKAVRSGNAPAPSWQQRPAPSPDSSPLIGKSPLLSPVEVDRWGKCLSCEQSIGWLPENKLAHSKNCPGLAK